MMDWKIYLNRSGKLNGKKLHILMLDPDYVDLQIIYSWCKSVAELYYCDTNNITEQPKCYCGNNTNYNRTDKKYYTYCSQKCMTNSIGVQLTRTKTNLANCGYECPLQSPKIRKKGQITNLQRFGVIHPMQSSTIKNKVKLSTMMSCGYEYALQSPTIKEQMRKTNIEKYGFDHPSKSPIIKEKKRLTNVDKLGCNSPLESEHIKFKITQTNIEKYGVSNPAQAHISKNALDKLNNPDWLKEQHYILEKPWEKICKELNVSETLVGKYAKKHNIKTVHFFSSEAEKDIYNFIIREFIDIHIISNDRTILKPYELDIYIPELKLAFEYDGSFWHKNKREQDRWKTFRCKELGISLYHIHERYWQMDQEYVKLIILKIINKRLENKNG